MPNLRAIVLALLPAILVAQTSPWKEVVPTTAAASEGPTNTALPFGSSLARRVMFA